MRVRAALSLGPGAVGGTGGTARGATGGCRRGARQAQDRLLQDSGREDLRGRRHRRPHRLPARGLHGHARLPRLPHLGAGRSQRGLRRGRRARLPASHARYRRRRGARTSGCFRVHRRDERSAGPAAAGHPPAAHRVQRHPALRRPGCDGRATAVLGLKDSYYYNVQVPFLGQTRADLEYPIKSFFDVGANVASSSDFPVTPWPNPMVSMQAGVMRWLPESIFGGNPAPGDVLWPEERCTIQQMIHSHTMGPAYANFLEKVTGSLEVGKSADLVVVRQGPHQHPARGHWRCHRTHDHVPWREGVRRGALSPSSIRRLSMGGGLVAAPRRSLDGADASSVLRRGERGGRARHALAGVVELVGQQAATVSDRYRLLRGAYPSSPGRR